MGDGRQHRCSPRKRNWKQHGQSRHRGSPTGSRTSPSCVDDLAVIRSLLRRRHQPLGRVCQMNTGSILGGRPSPRARGSPTAWAPRTRTCPASSCCTDDRASRSAARATGAPASCPPPTRARASAAAPTPILAPRHPPTASATAQQRRKLDLLDQLNRQHADGRDRTTPSSTPASQPTSWPSACRPHAPEAVDLAQRDARRPRRSTAWTTRRPPTFGRNCLLARRLVERGVRFVQLYCGAGSKWDAHANIEDNHSQALPRDATSRSPACSRT